MLNTVDREKEYLEDFNKIDLDNNPVKIIQKSSCNHGQFWICKTLEQFDFVIDKLFEEYKIKHQKFIETTKTSVVYDGIVYGLTYALLDKALNSNLTKDKYIYLRFFSFCGDGVFFVEPNDFEKSCLSKYPF